MRHSAHPVTGAVNTLRRALTPNHYVYSNYQFCKVHAVHSHSVDLLPTGLTGMSTYTASNPTSHLLKKVRHLSSYSPTVGDIVVVARGGQGPQATTIFVLGKFA